MDLILFCVLVAISLVLIVIGLTHPTESAQSLVGFFFLFLLALILINGNLEVRSGQEVNTIYVYGDNYDGYHYDDYNESAPPSINDVNLFHTNETTTYHYTAFNDTTSHRIGYYLALASALGFIGNLFSIGRTKWRRE